MKIEEARPDSGPHTPRTGNALGRVLEYLNERPDEEFRFSGPEIAQGLGIPQGTVSHALWMLEHEGFIGKAKLPRGVWYGSHEALAALIRACKAEGITVQTLQPASPSRQ